MAVGLQEPKSLLPVAGFSLAAGASGLRANNDLVIMHFPEGSRVCALFTQSSFVAAPVDVARRHLQSRAPRALCINAGNANAGTGQSGHEDALILCSKVAQLLGIETTEVLPFSTGVIGERLAVQTLSDGLEQLPEQLSEHGWLAAAKAIMTTDTLAKGISRKFIFQGQERVITGIAKGSGMMCPDMATLLAFMATDAPVAEDCLQDILADAVRVSFNRITVDGDTSTNDACVLTSTGQSIQPLVPGSDDWQALSEAVKEVALHLAQSIVRDGEGATHFINVQIEAGRTEDECLQLAYTLAHSPLVKTAAFGNDPNWGRLLMAIGRAGITNLDTSRISIFLDDVCVFTEDKVAASYTEAAGASVMAQDDLTIRVILGRGSETATVWTCDLSYDYVKINADYRT